MKKINFCLIIAIAFSLISLISGVVTIDVQQSITHLVIVPIVAGLCGIKYWILYFLEMRTIKKISLDKGEEK